MIPSYFPMDSIKRCLVFVVFLVCCITLAVLSVAMLTQEWTVVKPVRIGLNVSVRATGSIDATGNRFQGLIHFGLFEGKKILNYGFGNRIFDTKIVCIAKLKVCMFSTKENSTERVKDLQENLYISQLSTLNGTETEAEVLNNSLMMFSLWTVTVASMSLAGLFAIIGAAFSMVNVIKGSVEVVTGFLGLYLWNGLGALFSMVALLSWVAHYFMKFRNNVMTKEELKEHWISEYRACMGYSFYMVVGAVALFLVNTGLVTLIIKQPWVARKLKADLRKKLSNRRFVPKAPIPRINKNPKGTVVMSV